jgi:hypothetical protein
MADAAKYILCPYCGLTQAPGERCQDCGGLFDTLSRKATQIAMGPWYIRDKSLPFRPGCSYEVLLKQIRNGKITRSTVIRGPTTRQFWSVARNVPGVAHLLGYCHRCGRHVAATAAQCPHCQEPFQTPPERDDLGLLYPTEAAAMAAQRQLEIEISQRSGMPASAGPIAAGTPGDAPGAQVVAAAPVAAPPAAPPSAPGFDLLDEVLGSGITLADSPVPAAKPPGAERSRLLQLDEPAAAPVGPIATVNGSAFPGPQPLDFTPSDGPAESAAALEPNRGKLKLVVWLLIAADVLLVAAVLCVGFVLLKPQHSASAPSGGPATSAPDGPAANRRPDLPR